MKNRLSLISIGPGDLGYLLPVAQQALQMADMIIGYQYYLDLVAPLLTESQQIITSQLGSEMERARKAVELARQGKSVAMISSGDIGIYAMASPIYDVLREQEWDGSDLDVVTYPGVSAIQAVSAAVGAPLGHDFCTISLSDFCISLFDASNDLKYSANPLNSDPSSAL